jgi:hypothetical protein
MMQVKVQIFGCLLVFVLVLTLFNPIEIRAQQIWDSEVLLDAPEQSFSNEAIALDSHGKPHVLMIGDSIYHKWSDSTGWHEETVDKAGALYLAYVARIIGSEGSYANKFLNVNTGQGWQSVSFGEGWYVKLCMDQYDRPCLIDGRLNYRSDDGQWMNTFSPYGASVYACSPDGRFQGILASKQGLIWSRQELPGRGVRLEMPPDALIRFWRIYLNAYLRSDGLPLHQAPLCILLEYQQNYWFWPEWTGQFNVEYVDVKEKGSALLPIPMFHYWSPPIEGLTFWGALLNDDMTEIIGGVDGIGKWEFSIQ